MPAAPLNESAATLASRAWQSILFPHDYQPGPNAGLAIGAALRLLGRREGAGASWAGGDAARQAELDELRDAQIECTLSQNYQARGGGGEHLIFRAEPHDGRIYKATWHEQFGWVPKLNRAGQLRLCPPSGLHDVWYRPADQMLVCDAVAGNFVRTADGQLFAIDLPAALVAGIRI